MLTATISRLLPGSIVPTPSIMKLFEPPPVESELPARFPSSTPGTRLMNSVKFRVAIGRLVTASVSTANDRSPVADWISGVSPRTSTTSVVPPTSSVSAPSVARDPGLSVSPDRFSVLNAGMLISIV